MATYLPGFGQLKISTSEFRQKNPIESKYSPRLFGAPPQLSSLCDMRIDSQYDGHEGETGDWYRNNVLKPAQVANFFVGRALFTGGYNGVMDVIRQCLAYNKALQKYDIFGRNDVQVNTGVNYNAFINDQENAMRTIRQKNTETTPSEVTITTETSDDPTETTSDTGDVAATDVGSSSLSIEGALETVTEGATNTWSTTKEIVSRYASGIADAVWGDDDTQVSDLDALDWSGVGYDSSSNVINTVASSFGGNLAMLAVPLITSLSIGQPFYTFEADWQTYINNVKMMINSAIVMLGLQRAKIRIGNRLYPIGMDVQYTGDTDVWTNYRYITPDEDNPVGDVTSIDNLAGETSQYVSFMVDTLSANENYSNSTTESKIYSTMQQGSDIGKEIAFITNSSANDIDDGIIKMAGTAVGLAESVLNTLTFGVGKFVTGALGSMARSYIGEHPIYPKIFDRHDGSSSMTLNIKLRASRGDPYTYLIDVLVPLFHIMGMALPKMSQYSAGAYQYPPIIQCQIPGLWGTRLGMITQVGITKNPDGQGLSVNGYPMSINVSVTIENLTHCMVTTPMNKPAYFLNNHTMFDYIAQCTGVDKYRNNPSARLVTRLALAASYGENFFYNLGNAFANEITTYVNKLTRINSL